MTKLARAHTAAAVFCMTTIVLVPVGLWLYARAASVDRGPVVRRNEAVFRRIAQPSGARVVAEHSYASYRWGIQGSLVPVDDYQTEFWVRLPGVETRRELLTHYARALPSWRRTTDEVDTTFQRGGLRVAVSTAEATPGPDRIREYAVYVSQ